MSASSSLTAKPAPATATQAGAENPDGLLEALQVDADNNLLVNVAAGTITASNPSVGPTGSAVPADATMVGGTDGTNLRALSVNSSGVLALPQGAATAANQSTANTSLATIAGAIGTNTGSPPAGVAVVAGINSGGTAINTAQVDNQGHLKVDVITAPTTTVTGTVAATQSGTWNITDISGTISLPTGAATEATLSTLNGKVTACNTGAVTISSALPAGSNVIGHVIIDSGSTTVVTGTVAVTQSGTWTVQPGNTANTTPWLVKQIASSSAVTSVASSASSVSLLASNSGRLGATFYNDSTQICYLKLGATASNTSYTVQLGPNGYYELPPGQIYTGAVDGIWASANGNMRITELS